MRDKNYYRVRLMVRLAFWGAVALGSFWLAKTSIESWDNYKCQMKEVVVQPHDTLWGITERNCDGSIQNAVDDLINERGTGVVQVGQTIYFRDNP